ncbi:MAG TPA: hypothetical protein VM925_24740 [Labilithrix sp.]|nr:hypothetical protein [Labilithrix sp.]
MKRERALSESESGPTADGEGPEGAFDYAPDLSLLPFDVRLAKVASVAGIETDDSALATMRARRFDLGDHDHAKGVKADLTWSASRIGTWVKALRPVCASTAMRRSYPALPQNLGELVLAAYGRAATDEDRAAVKEAVAASALDSESEYQVICLAILSSLEFVAR